MATVLHPVLRARRDEMQTLPYTVVMETTLAIDALSMSMSLIKLNRKAHVGEELTKRGVGTVAVGLRRETDAVVDTIASIEQRIKVVRAADPLLDPAAVFKAAGLDLVKVLARQGRGETGWGSTGLVVDGAIRVLAAQRAGMADAPVQLVAPVYPDTPPEALFVHFNWTHGQRLTDSERDAIFRILAHRYREDHPHDRDAAGWSEWLAARSSVPGPIILAAIQNLFQTLTPDQARQLEADLRAAPKEKGGVPGAVHRLAGTYRVSRTAIQNRARALGLWPATAPKDETKNETDEGKAFDILAASVDKFDTRRNAAELAAKIKAAQLHDIIRDLNDWAKHEAPEYRIEQAKPIWDRIDGVIMGGIRFGIACEIFRDGHVADRYVPLLKEWIKQGEATRALKRAKTARRKAANVRSRK